LGATLSISRAFNVSTSETLSTIMPISARLTLDDRNAGERSRFSLRRTPLEPQVDYQNQLAARIRTKTWLIMNTGSI